MKNLKEALFSKKNLRRGDFNEFLINYFNNFENGDNENIAISFNHINDPDSEFKRVFVIINKNYDIDSAFRFFIRQHGVKCYSNINGAINSAYERGYIIISLQASSDLDINMSTYEGKLTSPYFKEFIICDTRYIGNPDDKKELRWIYNDFIIKELGL